jgi:hypothetical protein
MAGGFRLDWSLPMSPGRFVLGCCVLLAGAGGLIVSNHVVNAMIPLKSSHAAKATEAPARAQPQSPSDLPVTGEHPNDANAEAATPTGRTCTDLNGRTFGWNWPNVPFGTATCSDAGRKAGK